MTEAALQVLLGTVARGVRQTGSNFPKNVVKGCPIPFFGNILGARVLTVGVNPSATEFVPLRNWKEPLKRDAWCERLLRYFNWPGVPPHEWFETWSICLGFLGVSYADGSAAQLDISPRATKAMVKNAETNHPEFRSMVEHDVKWFFELLSKLPQVQLLLVAGPIPRADGTKQQLADFIREQAGAHGAKWMAGEPLPRLVTTGHPGGIPVFICPFEPGVDGLYAMVRQVHRNRELLLRLSAPGTDLVPILPARLDWPSAIGSFLLSFGMLEYFVGVFLKDRIAEDEFDKVKEWHLKDRLVRMAKYLKDEGSSPVEQSSFEALIKRVEPMRELRNHIAHGHMNVRFDPGTGKANVTLLKAKDVDGGCLPATKHLDFEELQSALATMAQLNQEFERLAGFKPEENATLPGGGQSVGIS